MEFDLEWESSFGPEDAAETFEEMLEASDDRLLAAMAEAGLNVERGASQRSRRDTGTMAGAWESETEPDGNTIVTEVWNETDYAVYHELGTQDIAPAPMLRPAIEDEIRDLRRRIIEAVYDASVEASR